MAKFFLIYGTVVCLFFAYASFTGWTVWHSLVSGTWSPHGAATQNYHK